MNTKNQKIIHSKKEDISGNDSGLHPKSRELCSGTAIWQREKIMKLEFLQEIYEQPGYFSTVYLDTSGDAEDANKALELRWRSACESLISQGAAEETVKELSRAIGDAPFQQPHTGRKGQVLVAAEDTVLFTDELESPPTQFSDDEKSIFGAVPHLMPYLRIRSSRVPYLLVMVDREGADISIVDNTLKESTRTVEHDSDNPIRKSRDIPRGADEQTHFNAVEEQWKSNADFIARQIMEEADESDSEVIVLGGDPQMRSILKDRLPQETEKLVVDTDASHRGADENNQHLRVAISEAVASAVQSRTEETVADFESKRGNNGAVAEGWREVIAALQGGQVHTVLWARTADSSKRHGDLFIGSEPNMLAEDSTTLRQVGSTWVERVPAEDALLRAVIGTGAGIEFIDSNQVRLSENVGAVLRFSTEMKEAE